MHHLVVLVRNMEAFERFFAANPRLREAGLVPHPVAVVPGGTPGKALNRFFATKTIAPEAWVILCSDYLEWMQNPLDLLRERDPNALYGIWGVRQIQTLMHKKFLEYTGKLPAYTAEGKGCFYGTDFADAMEVDALAGLCLMARGETLARLAQPFDERFTASLFVEDFCLMAREKGVPSRVLHGEAFVHAPMTTLSGENFAPQDGDLFAEKYGASWLSSPATSIPLLEDTTPQAAPKDRYHWRMMEKPNLAPSVAASMMDSNRPILDVGCAHGDNGLFFHQKLNASLYGMDYDLSALAYAQINDAYQEVSFVDLEQLHPADFSRYYGFFHHIFMGDVIEHLRSPLEVLRKCSLFLSAKGSFIVSLPNVMHAYVTSNLLNGSFDYLDKGILDATHVRFFTAKSMANLFARAGLAVDMAKPTFQGPAQSVEYPVYPNLPDAIYDLFYANKHFFVQQYVCKLTPRQESFEALQGHNLRQLEASPGNNIPGWLEVAPYVEWFRKERHARQQKRKANEIQHQTLQATLSVDASAPLRERILASGLFDAEWYGATYPDVVASGMDLLEHYCLHGWKEGKNPGPAFDTLFYLTMKPKFTEHNICPLIYHVDAGRANGFPTMPPTKERETEAAVTILMEQYTRGDVDKRDFVPKAAEAFVPEPGDPRIVAYYLPQFFPNPMNDKWWGKGFTEWTNVTKALPQYEGHYQPHLPLDLGFYDLRLDEVAKEQIDLAKHYGIYGFCYYYYWFGGVKMLDLPVYRLLEHPELDFPFSIAWANEPWTALWDGGQKEILIDQPREIDVEAFFADILPLLRDPRYIRVDGKPMLTVYRPLFHARKHFVWAMDTLRELAQRNGFPGLHIVFVRANQPFSAKSCGGDALAEFPPHGTAPDEVYKLTTNPRFQGRIFDTRSYVKRYKTLPPPEEIFYRCVFPQWDNSARKVESGCSIFENCTPDVYEDWLRQAILFTKQQNPAENNIVFVNAWNEWGEGAHLEPDRRYGFAYLEATKRAVIGTR